MERTTEAELKSHLMQCNEEFRRLSTEHSEYDRKLTDLESRHHLTEEEQIEEVRLKKLKLRLKDRMSEIMRDHRTHQVV
jgi:uncharacterized protein YdcH (DUF465 family)